MMALPIPMLMGMCAFSCVLLAVAEKQLCSNIGPLKEPCHQAADYAIPAAIFSACIAAVFFIFGIGMTSSRGMGMGGYGMGGYGGYGMW